MLLQLLIAVGSCTFFVNARLCQDVIVRNGVDSFEKYLRGCTVIDGNLNIALIEHETVDSFSSLTFPELREIRGFLLMFRVYGLTSLSYLFPNLTIIRGENLIQDYSFVLFDMIHLQEIGLSNLKYILRGSTRIERCPILCFVDTINWSLIGGPSHKLYYNNTTKRECGPCPAKCKGFCWSYIYCQATPPDKCHPECVGCTAPNSPDKCVDCRFYRDNTTCVNECPKEKVLHPTFLTCMTDDECYNTTLVGSWWPFQGECVNSCPPQFYKVQGEHGLVCESCGNKPCPKICDALEINSTESSSHLHGCTRINGSLSIRIDNKMKVDELYRDLDMIEEIDGFLKIRRSAPLTSLEFFKNLRIIHGNELYNNRYSLIVFKNQNLLKLWEHNHTVELKKGTIFFHDNNKLCTPEIDKFYKTKLDYDTYDVSPHSNGDNRTCKYTELNITIVNTNCTNVTLMWENVTNTRNLSPPIGYLLSYTEDPFTNITIFDENLEGFENIWESVLVVDNITHQIVNLNPFTQYAVFIKLYTNSSNKNVGRDEDAHTNITHFKTLSDDPSEPLHFDAVSNSSDSVILSWDDPVFPNGILGHYELVVYYQRDDDVFIAERNYCKHPHHDISKADNACCHTLPLFPTRNIEFTCDKVNIILNADSKPGGCKNYMYSIEGQNVTIGNNTVEFVSAKPIDTHKIVKRSSFPTNSPYIMEIKIKYSNVTTHTVENLTHFSMFVFVLKVCHREIKTQCSSSVMTFKRTLPKEHADDIPAGLSVHVKNSIAIVTWFEPREPNSMIVSYQVEYKKTDVNNSKPSTECITREMFIDSNHEFQIKTLPLGQYAVRVKAVSLAGLGTFSEFAHFEILESAGPSIAIIIVIIIVVILIGVFYYHRYYYKKRHSLDQETLITNQTSDYTGPIYVEDEWEIDREDVEIYNRIAQGTFIMVHTGLIKSQNRPCAVKTTRLKDIHDKIAFLNETSMMKWLSDAHHVVKLLGVVSKGQQPLVLIELVSERNLKTYLRQLRTSSINTTITETYRMAAEIADGMVYLSSKKFVHRDLAARNCMVSSDHTVKIGDYGISKDIYRDDYFRKETGSLIPVRWMAPESLANDVFTTDSDVWSYGVLLWEIVTFGEQPYRTLSNEAVSDFVTSRGTLQRPSDCPTLLYEIMERCWKWCPNDRPLFTDVVARLESRVGQHFSLVSFYHSTEGEQYRRSGKLRVFNAPALSTPFSRDTTVRWHTFDDNVDF